MDTPAAKPSVFVPASIGVVERGAASIVSRFTRPVQALGARTLGFVDRLVGMRLLSLDEAPTDRAPRRTYGGGFAVPVPWYLDEGMGDDDVVASRPLGQQSSVAADKSPRASTTLAQDLISEWVSPPAMEAPVPSRSRRLAVEGGISPAHGTTNERSGETMAAAMPNAWSPTDAANSAIQALAPEAGDLRAVEIVASLTNPAYARRTDARVPAALRNEQAWGDNAAAAKHASVRGDRVAPTAEAADAVGTEALLPPPPRETELPAASARSLGRPLGIRQWADAWLDRLAGSPRVARSSQASAFPGSRGGTTDLPIVELATSAGAPGGILGGPARSPATESPGPGFARQVPSVVTGSEAAPASARTMERRASDGLSEAPGRSAKPLLQPV